ncbi:hypothetical protein DH2020_001474 [Rehmannia glutinosa]|uniref:RNase H type-1 domain-containing protein n=1 Tax=Rehmannia glutinosa TaxID=99300 RepID=A0ABR0XZV4_REHGL
MSPQAWVELIVRCVSTVRYTFSNNNQLIGRVVPKRSFRQVGGKEVLIKSMLQAIPTYVILCFRIPQSICADIEKELANFWFNLEGGQWSVHTCGMDKWVAGYRGKLSMESNENIRDELKGPNQKLIYGSESSWIALPMGTVRHDTYICFIDDNGLYGVGGSIRDNNGDLFVVFGKAISCRRSILEGELRAMLYGMEVLMEQQFVSAHVATDSLLVVQAVT